MNEPHPGGSPSPSLSFPGCKMVHLINSPGCSEAQRGHAWHTVGFTAQDDKVTKAEAPSPHVYVLAHAHTPHCHSTRYLGNGAWDGKSQKSSCHLKPSGKG